MQDTKEIGIDEIELALRRFASKYNNRELEKLLNNLFTSPVGREEDKETQDGQE